MHDLVGLVIMGCIPGACSVFPDKDLLWSYEHIPLLRLCFIMYMNKILLNQNLKSI